MVRPCGWPNGSNFRSTASPILRNRFSKDPQRKSAQPKLPQSCDANEDGMERDQGRPGFSTSALVRGEPRSSAASRVS